MDNLHVMKIGDSFQGVFDDEDGIAFGEFATFTDSLEKLTSCCEFCDDVKVLGALKPFIEFNNVRVVETFEKVHFVVDHVLVALDIFLCNDLDGHRSIWSVGLLNYSISIWILVALYR